MSWSLLFLSKRTSLRSETSRGTGQRSPSRNSRQRTLGVEPLEARWLLSGGFAEYLIPTDRSAPQGITAGSDGLLWFTEQNGNRIGQITPAGIITEFSIPTNNSNPMGITAGPDGSLWFTETSPDYSH